MTTQLTISEITRYLDDHLSPEALDYWSNTTERNYCIVLAQREGIEAAVREIEDQAAE